MNEKMKYYNSKNLGVIGCYPKHEDGDYTFLIFGKNPWIRTKDLYDTYEEASKSSYAKFSGEN